MSLVIDMDNYDPNKLYPCGRYVKTGGFTRLMYMIVSSYSYDEINNYLKCHLDEIDKKNNMGSTALMIVCNNDMNINNADQIVKLLLQNNADVNLQNNIGYTALMINMDSNKDNGIIAEILLQHNAKVNIQNHIGCCALSIVVEHDGYYTKHLIELLMKYGANINIQDCCGNTVLSNMIRNPNSSFEICKTLLENGADPNLKNKDEWTPLMIAAKYSGIRNKKEFIQLLLDHAADINLQNNTGYSALIFATIYYNDTSTNDTIELLLKNNANADLYDNDGCSPLMHAIKNYNDKDSLNAIEALLIHSKDHMSAFMSIIKNSNKPDSEELLQLFLKRNPYACCNNICLRYAIKHNCSDNLPKIIKILLENKADPNYRDESNNTALLMVMDLINNTNIRIMEQVIQLLLEYNADVNLCNKYYDSILCTAIWHCKGIAGGDYIIKLLLDKGADVLWRSKDNKTALFEACLINCRNINILSQKNIIKLLLEHGSDINVRFNPINKTVIENIISNHMIYGSDEVFRAVIDILKLLLQYDYHMVYRLENYQSIIKEHLKLLLDYGLNISQCNLNLIKSHGYENYIMFYYHVKYSKIQTLKELLKYCHEFQYRETSIRSRINLLHMNLEYKNYTLKEVHENYKDVIEYLNVLDMNHLRNKIKFYLY